MHLKKLSKRAELKKLGKITKEALILIGLFILALLLIYITSFMTSGITGYSVVDQSFGIQPINESFDNVSVIENVSNLTIPEVFENFSMPIIVPDNISLPEDNVTELIIIPDNLINITLPEENVSNITLPDIILVEGVNVIDRQDKDVNFSLSKFGDVSKIILEYYELEFNRLSNGTIKFDEVEGIISPKNAVFRKVFAISLDEINFSSGYLYANASSNLLYNCRNFDFDLGLCLGKWEKVKNLEIGKEYSVELGKGGFAEGLEEVNEILVSLRDKTGKKIKERKVNVTEADVDFSEKGLFGISKLDNNIKIENIKSNFSEINIFIDESNDSLVRTNVIAVNENFDFDNATIRLIKNNDVNEIVYCKEFDFDNFRCGDWEKTEINFSDLGSLIEFKVEKFSAYAGGFEISGYSIQADGGPGITLISPINFANISTTNVTIICNATDDWNLRNISLYHNISGTFKLNDTWWFGGLDYTSTFNGSVLLYHFDNDSTVGEKYNTSNHGRNVYDYSYGNYGRNNGTVYSYDTDIGNINNSEGVNWSATSGKFNGAFEFDGLDDHIKTGTGSSLDPKNITIEFWVKLNENGDYWFIGRGDSSDSRFQYISSSPGLVLSDLNISGHDFDISATSILLQVDVWYHLAWTYDGNDVKIYKDGVLVANSAGNESDSGELRYSVANQGWDIGAGLYNPAAYTSPLNGTIDELAIYNRSLTAAEIRQHYMNNPLSNSTSVNWTINVNDDTSALWNCKADDNSTSVQSNWGDANWTFNVDSDANPNVTLISPADLASVSTTKVIMICNVSDDFGLKNISLYHNISGSFKLNETWHFGGVDVTNNTVLLMHFDNDSDIGETYNTSNSGNIVFDYSYGKNNGTTYGGANKTAGALGINWTNDYGKIDGAFEFDGVDDYINVGQDLFETDNTGTITAWIKPNDFTTDNVILQSGVLTSGGNVMQFMTGIGGTIVFQHYTGGGSNNLIVNVLGSLQNTSKWYHVAITSDGSTWKMYVDGNEEPVNVLLGSNNGRWFNDLPAGTHDVDIGRFKDSASPDTYFNGTIDEVAVYNRSLNAAEIRQLYMHRSLSNSTSVNWSINVSYGTTALWNCKADDNSIGLQSDWGDNNWTFSVVNNTPPIVTNVFPVNNSLINIHSINITYNVTDSDSGSTGVIDSCNLFFNISTDIAKFPINLTNQTGIQKNINQTFNITVDHGTYTWFVGCNDTGGLTANSSSFNISIYNTAPTFSGPIPNQSWNEDESKTINLSVYFTDAENDDINWSYINGSNIGVSINNETGIATLTPVLNWYGVSSIVFNATDGWVWTASNNVTLTVNSVIDCGDGVCEGSETCGSCVSDCGDCPGTGGGELPEEKEIVKKVVEPEPPKIEKPTRVRDISGSVNGSCVILDIQGNELNLCLKDKKPEIKLNFELGEEGAEHVEIPIKEKNYIALLVIGIIILSLLSLLMLRWLKLLRRKELMKKPEIKEVSVVENELREFNFLLERLYQEINDNRIKRALKCYSALLLIYNDLVKRTKDKKLYEIMLKAYERVSQAKKIYETKKFNLLEYLAYKKVVPKGVKKFEFREEELQLPHFKLPKKKPEYLDREFREIRKLIGQEKHEEASELYSKIFKDYPEGKINRYVISKPTKIKKLPKLIERLIKDETPSYKELEFDYLHNLMKENDYEDAAKLYSKLYGKIEKENIKVKKVKYSKIEGLNEINKVKKKLSKVKGFKFNEDYHELHKLIREGNYEKAKKLFEKIKENEARGDINV